ncbi:MAG: ArsR/SmtB family transcription factor [Alphaproteobacteria bacterium]
MDGGAIMPASQMFKALSNPHRLRLFLRLADCCQGVCAGTGAEVRRCVGDLGADVGIAPSTLSHHLKELRRAGLIRMERNGQRVECWTEPALADGIAGFLENVAWDRPEAGPDMKERRQ